MGTGSTMGRIWACQLLRIRLTWVSGMMAIPPFSLINCISIPTLPPSYWASYSKRYGQLLGTSGCLENQFDGADAAGKIGNLSDFYDIWKLQALKWTDALLIREKDYGKVFRIFEGSCQPVGRRGPLRCKPFDQEEHCVQRTQCLHPRLRDNHRVRRPECQFHTGHHRRYAHITGDGPHTRLRLRSGYPGQPAGQILLGELSRHGCHQYCRLHLILHTEPAEPRQPLGTARKDQSFHLRRADSLVRRHRGHA